MDYWLEFVAFIALLCALVVNLAFLFAARAPAASPISVRGLRPVGGVRTIEVRKGETIRFDVMSDRPEAVHLHGYGIAREIGPGKVASFAVPALLEGTFAVELAGCGVQIAEVIVEPRPSPPQRPSQGSTGVSTHGETGGRDADSSHGFLT